jgi:hypothetical protein
VTNGPRTGACIRAHDFSGGEELTCRYGGRAPLVSDALQTGLQEQHLWAHCQRFSRRPASGKLRRCLCNTAVAGDDACGAREEAGRSLSGGRGSTLYRVGGLYLGRGEETDKQGRAPARLGPRRAIRTCSVHNPESRYPETIRVVRTMHPPLAVLDGGNVFQNLRGGGGSGDDGSRNISLLLHRSGCSPGICLPLYCIEATGGETGGRRGPRLKGQHGTLHAIEVENAAVQLCPYPLPLTATQFLVAKVTSSLPPPQSASLFLSSVPAPGPSSHRPFCKMCPSSEHARQPAAV